MVWKPSTVTSPAGHVGHYLSNQVKTPFCVDVRDYGALGDGVTDDTLSIQAALTPAEAAGGGVVFLPAIRRSI